MEMKISTDARLIIVHISSIRHSASVSFGYVGHNTGLVITLVYSKSPIQFHRTRNSVYRDRKKIVLLFRLCVTFQGSR